MFEAAQISLDRCDVSNLHIYPTFSHVIFHQLGFLICEKKIPILNHNFVPIFAVFSETLMIHTVAPGYGDAFKEDQEQQTHSTGRVVVKQFEHIDPTLVTEK